MIKLIKIVFYAACLTAVFTLNLYWLWFGIVILTIGTLVEAFRMMPLSTVQTKKEKSKKNFKKHEEHEIYYHLFLNNKK